MSDLNEHVLSQEKGEEILTKFEKESAFRRLEGIPAKIVFVLAVCWSLFQLYTAFFGTFPSTLQRAPHIGAALTIIYLLYPIHKSLAKNGIPFYDYILAAACVVVSSYHVFLFDQLQLRSGLYTETDKWISIVAILLVLEAARRVAGPVIVLLASFFLFYARFGNIFPGFMQHSGLSVKRIATFEWLGTEGILGSPIYVSSTFIFLFLVFATFLKKSGVGDWMTGLAMGTCGGAVGGPAKAAVVASALQGTVSGSSVANTVSTGSITIPLMKKTGYKPEFAGAVEAAASTGGQIMPPIMGAAAFIMTEYINESYSYVALAACIPALLYFTGIFTNVHFEALKQGLRGMSKDEMPKVGELIKSGWYMITPIIVIVGMLVAGRTAMRAALFGIISCLIIWAIEIIRSTGKFDALEYGKRFIYGLEESARSALSVASTCACAGIIVGVITLTGLGLKMAGGIVGIAEAAATGISDPNVAHTVQLLLTMVFTMLCSLLLGMGVPTTANYIIQATISAPALVHLGVPPIAAHMFVFYFGIVADITPPVALAAFAGAGIADANPMKTGFNAFRLGFAAYLVPYIFVLNPVLVLVNSDGLPTGLFALIVLKAIATAFIGMMGIATGMTGYYFDNCNILERILLIAFGICLVDPGTFGDIIGIAGMVVLAILQVTRKKRRNASF